MKRVRILGTITMKSKKEYRDDHGHFRREFYQEELRVRRVVHKEIERARMRRRDDEDECCPVCLKEHVIVHFTRNQSRGKFLFCCGKLCCAECSEKLESTAITVCPICKITFPDKNLQLSKVRQYAKNGNSWALSTLAFAYKDGNMGMKNDKRMALMYCRQAAEKGDADCQYLLALGFFYGQVFGLSLPKSNQTAVQFAKDAAERGHSQAQYFLGRLYQNGNGVPRNVDEAMRWMTLSASQGFGNAALWLGIYYEKLQQEVLAFPFYLAFYWFGKAAESGNPMGHFYLAKSLQYGYHHIDTIHDSGVEAVASTIWLYEKARTNAFRELGRSQIDDTSALLYERVVEISDVECQSLVKKIHQGKEEYTTLWIESFFENIRN